MFYTGENFHELTTNINKIFFFRVCGTGMGAAAILLREKGFHIEGGDFKFAPPMSDYLQSTGIPLHDLSSIDDEFLKTFDLIVVGNVVPRGGEDATRLESLGVPLASFPTAMGELVLKEMNVIGIAGTHGKTTTTYLATQVFENLGEDPGYFIGGVMPSRPSAQLGGGRYFFIESDEYDCVYFEKISKFRRYHLDEMILTSLEFDHADIFENLDQIKAEFLSVLKGFKGHLYVNNDYQASIDLIDQSGIPDDKVHLYGNPVDGPHISEVTSRSTTFTLKLANQLESFKTNILGPHNILNLTSVILFAFQEGFSVPAIRQAVSDLSMVKRRQEIRGQYGDMVVIDDFAHHPRAVECTLESIRQQFPDKQLLTLMEPHSATARSNIFQDGFAQALSTSDHLILTQLHRPTSVKETENLDLPAIIAHIEDKGKRGEIVSTLEELVESLKPWEHKDAVLLVLSNGTCLGLWESDFVKNLHPYSIS